MVESVKVGKQIKKGRFEKMKNYSKLAGIAVAASTLLLFSGVAFANLG